MAKSNFTVLTTKKIVKVLDSIEQGMAISIACEKHELSRPTFYKWVNDSEDNKKKLYAIIDQRTSDVEDALFRKAIDGDTTAMIFWLKNRSRDRWADKREIDLGSTSVVINVSNNKAGEGLKDILGEADS